ncbi:hypothetical protein C7M84_021266 [Penaeus vannamei]|uniref:Uncharacterized protein n=1 Tax=Penaeus vannamei TaxID=6689 RepID=A0A423U8U4_PENVA|nr:hypothetical protein C7M84_021266 [Penaeus vannamei]
MLTQGFVAVALVLTVCGCAPSPQVAVPPVPRGAEGTSIYNIWNHHNGRVPAVERSESGVGTILSPEYFKVVNLVPQDAPHPLYADSSLRTRFLADHMLFETPTSHLFTVKVTRQLPSLTTPLYVTAGVAKYPN